MAKEWTFHVVIYQSDGWFEAQCLECNLVAGRGGVKKLDALLEKLRIVLRVQIQADREAGVEPFSQLPRAPERFWAMYRNAWQVHNLDVLSKVGRATFSEVLVRESEVDLVTASVEVDIDGS